MTNTFLQIDNISKAFDGLHAIENLSLTIAAGERVALIGPNGSGKTTLFNLISGLYLPDVGQITLHNGTVRLDRLAPHQIAACGVARTFQTLRLFPSLTVLENVLIGMTPRFGGGFLSGLFPTRCSRRVEKEAHNEALEILAFFGRRLLSMANEPASVLSYANRRRLEIARALAAKPSLLLLDEPAAGMNPSETREILNDIRALHQKNLSLLLIEHDMALVEGLDCRVVAMDHGTVIASGCFEDVRRHPDVIEAYLGKNAND